MASSSSREARGKKQQSPGSGHIARKEQERDGGKTVHLESFLTEVCTGQHPRIIGTGPSVYVGSMTNVQCKDIHRVLLDLHNADDRIPAPTWFGSESFIKNAEENGDAYTSVSADTFQTHSYRCPAHW